MNSRRLALEILLKIEEGAYSNIVLDSSLDKIEDSRDKALITELVYGVIRQRNRLDYIIRQFSRWSVKELDKPVLLALRLGIYQIEFLDKIPGRAAVNESVNAVKKYVNRGAVGFTNGILRSYLRNKKKISYPNKSDRVNYLKTYYSHPEWLVKLWLKEYEYEETRRLCRYNNTAPDTIIRINRLKYSDKEVINELKENNIVVRPTTVPGFYRIKQSGKITELPFYEKGGFIVQGAAAGLAGYILNPEPGMKVLDMAAAPGGKTTHIAQLMNNKGSITALDIYGHKLKLLKENCQRLGVKNVNVIKNDARTYTSKNRYDMILVDAPCSGLGLIRQKPEIKWNRSYKDIEELRQIQLQIMNNAVGLVKTGGEILYSTCTLSRQENQFVVEKILDRYNEKLKLIDISNDLKEIGLENKFKIQNRMLEIFPPDTDTEGFFIAKFKKYNKK
ncbi:MAG: 16S rRNA (cytosine(967)-C(5))-methyltransferase RsmB [Halothermotrichaceae bacterium]